MSGLLSIKPKLYVCNVDENSIDKGNDYTKSFIEKYGSKNTLTISAEIENQLNELENEERKNYMKMINVDDTGLNLLIKKGYDLLSLETFFTSGIEETRALVSSIPEVKKVSKDKRSYPFLINKFNPVSSTLIIFI